MSNPSEKSLRKESTTSPVEIKREASKFSQFIATVRKKDEETNLCIYLGSGIYQVSIGIILLFLVSFLIGLPIVMAYPYLNQIMLWSFWILGIFYMVIGVLLTLIPFLWNKFSENTFYNRFIKNFVYYDSIAVFYLIPIGIFLGIALQEEYKHISQKNTAAERKGSNKLYQNMSVYQNILYLLAGGFLGISIISLILNNFIYPFILAPIAMYILIPVALYISKLLKRDHFSKKDVQQEAERDSSLWKLYFSLLFLAGLIHTLFGAVLIFILPPILLDSMDLLFPYINYELLNFLTIFGWISFVPGVILLISSLYSKKLAQIQQIYEENILIKIIWVLVLISSIFLILVFPIGTFF
ncbi:MAG: hypothetical protein EU548_01205, partial [Promethearchaeota archaeon]